MGSVCSLPGNEESEVNVQPQDKAVESTSYTGTPTAEKAKEETKDQYQAAPEADKAPDETKTESQPAPGAYTATEETKYQDQAAPKPLVVVFKYKGKETAVEF